MSRADTLFLCVANSTRSQMAEGLARQLCSENRRVFSAGSAPGVLNPLAVTAMAEIGIDISHHRSKGIDEVPLSQVGRVITLCAEEVCPALPAEVEQLHWPLPDPAAEEGDHEQKLEAVRETRDAIRRRVEMLFGRPLRT